MNLNNSHRVNSTRIIELTSHINPEVFVFQFYSRFVTKLHRRKFLFLDLNKGC